MISSLKTERLLLRPLCSEDVQGIFELRSNPDIVKYTGINLYNDASQAAAYIENIKFGMLIGDSAMWSLRLLEGRTFIGSICLWNFTDNLKTAEIGYDLLHDYHGQGYMSEALEAVTNYAFYTMGFNRIIADLLPENNKSANLLLNHGFYHVKDHDRPLAHGVFAMSQYELLKDHIA